MRKLQKFAYIVLIISLGIFLLNIQSGYTKQALKKTPNLVAASSNNFPPMNVLGKDGNLTGFGPELADAVIKEVGEELEHIHSSQWVEVLNWLETGQADFIHDTGYTQERDQFLDYSDPIIAMPEVIFVRPDEYSINDLDSLKGKTVACVDKHITHLYLKQFPEISVFIVKTPVEGIYELLSGKVDAFVYPKQIALYLVQNLRLRDKIKITGKPLRTLSWSMVVKQGNEELLQRLNEGIAKVHKSGQYDRIYKKWWGEKVLSGYTKEQLVILTIMATGISLTVMLSITLLLFSRRLKKRVKEKTILLSREIEERKIVEAKLEKEKEFINAVLENIEDGIVACDKDGVLTLFNRASREFHNLPEKPIPAEEWAQHYDLFLADGITPMKKEDIPLFCSLQGTHVKEMEMVIAPKKGKNRILLASGQPLHDERGNLLGAVVTMHDITERKYAEAELQKANDVLDIKVQERTRELLQLSEKLSKEIDERKKSEEALALSKVEHEEAQKIAQIGHWTLDFSTNSLTWSDETFRIFNLKKGEIEPTYEYFLSVIHPDDRDDVNNAFIDSVKNNTGYDITHRLLFNDGSIKYIHEQGKTYYNQSGNPYRSMGTVQDISLQKAIEHEKEQLMQKLTQSQKMESIGTLAGGIAHDFNNILSVIIGFSEMAKIQIEAGEKPLKDLSQISTAGKRAAKLVEQILAFSRQADHQMQILYPHLIVKEALKMLRSSLPTTVSLQEKIDSQCGAIMADPTNIHQIVMNLCTNALHALESEKGRISVKLCRQEVQAEDITESDVSPGPFIVLSVTDSGAGIDQEILDRIFDPYFTTKEKGKGTGLGLAVIYGIVKDYKGFIRVESTLNEGTTFHVYFPASKNNKASRAEVEAAIPIPRGSERILVVDDEENIILLSKATLTHLGYTVTGITNSEGALEKIDANPGSFDLVITDQTMPNLTGSELAQKILAIRPDMPIMLCTGYSSVISEQDALAIGIKKYVRKPCTAMQLARNVREVLDNG